MSFLDYPVQARQGDRVEVTLDHAANVRLLDWTNYQRYRRGETHRYHGGYMTHSPVRLSVPHAGGWHVVVDLGGYAGQVRASVSLHSRA